MFPYHKIVISPCRTYHIFEGKPLYPARFTQVGKFHEPGLAPVIQANCAFHINTQGEPAYPQKFVATYGFYEGMATVQSHDGWHHIVPDGTALYANRYAWCGNFQDECCTVRDFSGRYFHISLPGCPCYEDRWHYAGDFRDGIACVQNRQGYSTHIYKNGQLCHGQWFRDLEPFHKGFACAKLDDGWCHIDRFGKPIYSRRFAKLEPFYNQQARAENFDGSLEIINEHGDTICYLYQTNRDLFVELSADLVGFWKTQTIATAISLGIIELLPNSPELIGKNCNIPTINVMRLLLALEELKICESDKNGVYSLTAKGQFLKKNHPLTLADAALEYSGDLLKRWQDLPNILRQQPQKQPDIFNEVAHSADRIQNHHRMLASYALHDYTMLIPELAIGPGEIVLDAGGGTGQMASLVAKQFPTASVILMDFAEVIALAPKDIPNLQCIAGNLFHTWPAKANIVILARVLHDWNDRQAHSILYQAYQAMLPNSKIIILEMLLQDKQSAGHLCDLHLLAVTGGQERTAQQYITLLQQAGFVGAHIHSYHPENLVQQIIADKL